MAQFLTLSNFIINLDYVEKIAYVPEPLIASIFWASGCEEDVVSGEDAVTLLNAVSNLSLPNRFLSKRIVSDKALGLEEE